VPQRPLQGPCIRVRENKRSLLHLFSQVLGMLYRSPRTLSTGSRSVAWVAWLFKIDQAGIPASSYAEMTREPYRMAQIQAQRASVQQCRASLKRVLTIKNSVCTICCEFVISATCEWCVKEKNDMRFGWTLPLYDMYGKVKETNSTMMTMIYKADKCMLIGR
jgi:type IV secretory pathway protease TraF